MNPYTLLFLHSVKDKHIKTLSSECSCVWCKAADSDADKRGGEHKAGCYRQGEEINGTQWYMNSCNCSILW